MDDDFFEDTVSVIHYTDSQKSLGTTNAYSSERAEGSSGRSRRTYVVAVDSHDSDCSRPDGGGCRDDHRRRRTGCRDEDDDSDHSDDGFRRHSPPRELFDALVHDVYYASIKPPYTETQNVTQAEGISEDVSTQCTTDSLYACSLVSHEIFTQTSKTIFELAQIDHMKCTGSNAIETQTSRVSIVENKITEYRIDISGARTRFSRREPREGRPAGGEWRLRSRPSSGASSLNLERVSAETLRVIKEEPKSPRGSVELFDLSDEMSDNAYSSKYDTDFTDSLEDEHVATHDASRGDQDDASETSVPQSVDRDVAELYTKLEESFDLRSFDRPEAFDTLRSHVALTPLTEETAISWKDNAKTEPKENSDKKSIKKPELRESRDENREQFKLPPIQKPLSPRSPRRYTFGTASSGGPEFWDGFGQNLVSGESANITAYPGSAAPGRLPCIRCTAPAPAPRPANTRRGDAPPETISIGGNIRRLKPSAARARTHYSYTTESRSSSPGSGGAGAEVAARGADALAADMLARLRQATGGAGASLEPHVSAARYECSDGCGAKWAEAVEVLEDVPAVFRGLWGAVPEHRVADLIRLVAGQVESPRTRVATAACVALAAVLENTGYTKKPEFVEAVSTLLVKTGSSVAPVRRAANVALDGVVAGAPPAAAVAALCGAGLQHKSAAVRCATARLLVVACALARGGREVLRARPATAATARRLALRALSSLLQDRDQDTRRYAERLYAMLRPLEGFAAFFLADIDARTACRQMKKYDRLVAGGEAPPPSPR